MPSSQPHKNKPSTDAEKQDNEVEEDHNDQRKIKGYLVIFLLPYDTCWMMTVSTVGVIDALTILFLLTMQINENEARIYFILDITSDVLFFVDSCLGLLSRHFFDLQSDPDVIVLPIWLLVIQLISTFPDRLLTGAYDRTTNRIKRLIPFFDSDVLKIIRILYIQSYSRSQIGPSNSKIIIVGSYLLNMTLLIACGFCFSAFIYCDISFHCDASLRNARLTWTLQVATFGGLSLENQLDALSGLLTTTLMLSNFALCVWSVCDLSNISYSRLKMFFLFVFKKECTTMVCKQFGIGKSYRDAYLKYFTTYWRVYKGYHCNRRPFELLPVSIRQEIAVDISWMALKHSKVFRNMDLPFLRKISGVMTQEFLMAGEYVYRKDKVKRKMIYIVSGIIEVLSETDGETPILSFSSGTVLGETTLIINYKSTTSVRCKNNCELHCLHKKDFLKIAKYFPKQFHQIKREVINRYETAGNLREKFKHANEWKSGIKMNVDQLTITWLKNTLHKLMMKDGETSTEHECQNIFLREESDKFEGMLFTAKHLDKLAITGRIELVEETVFLKPTFPCVFQSESVVLYVWNLIVCICVVFAGFIIPFVALVEPIQLEWFSIFTFFIIIIYVSDIIVSVSTAVRTSTQFYADIKSILFYRIGTFTFWLDVISTYPLGMYACLLVTKITPHTHSLLLLNQILKMWKLKSFLEETGKSSTWFEVVAKLHVKHFLIVFYATYLSSCYLYAVNPTLEVEGETIFEKYSWFFFSAGTLFAFAVVPLPYDVCDEHFISCGIFNALSIIMMIVILSEMITYYSLKFYPKIKLEEVVSDVMNTAKAAGVEKMYMNRIIYIANAQYAYNYAHFFLYKEKFFNSLPDATYRRFKEELLLDLVSGMEIFKYARCDILSEICRLAKPLFVTSGEVIAYSGQVNDAFVCILSGYCDVYIGSSPIKHKTLKKSECISAVEVCLGIPDVNTTVASTCCELVVFDKQKIMNALSKYPEEFDLFTSAFDYDDLAKKLESLRYNELVNKKRKIVESLEIDKSFVVFGYRLQVDSKEEYEYYVPFDKIDPFSWIYVLLLRVTFMPFGRFMIYWEISRCVFAFLSSVLFVVSPIYYSPESFWQYILLFLDLTSLLDMYIRLHVCYYNRNGILVSHPLYTAKHYLTHAFLLDLIGVLPFAELAKTDQDIDNKFCFLLQSFHILQMYRYHGLLRVLTQNLPIRTFLHVIKYVPYCIVACNLSATLLTNMDCNFGPHIKPSRDYQAGVYCEEDSVFSVSNFVKPMSPIYVHLVGLYVSTSTITMIGMRGYKMKTIRDFSYGVVIGAFGAFSFFYIIANLVAVYSAVKANLLFYQLALRNVKKFMRKFKVREKLRNELINYYEYKWYRQRGMDLNKALWPFGTSLRQDLLWNVYGKILEKYSVFPSNSKAFLRQLLMQMNHEVMPEGSAIAYVNCINSDLFLIFKGHINVLAADGSLLVILGRGAICGNLNNYSMCRQTVALIPNGNVEFLKIEAVKFYKVIQKFPNVWETFLNLTSIHVDYLEGKEKYTKEIAQNSEKHFDNKWNRFVSIVNNHVFLPNTLGMTIWKWFITIFVCYFQFVCVSYCLAIYEFNALILIQSYISDILFALYVYTNFHTSYYDKSGNLIKDLTQIKLQQKNNKLIFSITIAILIPLDFIIWFIPDTYYDRRRLFTLLRIPKLLRIIFFLRHIKKPSMKLNVKVVTHRMLYFVSIASLCVHIFNCILLVISCASTGSRIPPVLCYEIRHFEFPFWLKFSRVYLDTGFVVLTFLVHFPQDFIYPQSDYLLAVFSFVMVVCTILDAFVFAHFHNSLSMKLHLQHFYTKEFNRLKFYMMKQDVSFDLYQKTWRHVRLLWTKYKAQPFPRLIQEAPPILKSLVLSDIFNGHIWKNPVFNKCHEDFVRQLVNHLKVVPYFPDDYIVFKGDIDETMYFIHEGEVAVVSEGDEVHLKAGDYFGVLQGLQPLTPHQHSFRSIGITDMLLLERTTWDYLLQFFPASRMNIYHAIQTYKGY